MGASCEGLIPSLRPEIASGRSMASFLLAFITASANTISCGLLCFVFVLLPFSSPPLRVPHTLTPVPIASRVADLLVL